MKLFLSRKSIMSAGSAVAGVVLLVGYTNCAPAHFNSSHSEEKVLSDSLNQVSNFPGDLLPGDVDPGPDVIIDDGDGGLVYSTTLSFDNETIEKTPVDVVWVVDNTDPRNRVAPKIRNNLKKFMEAVQDRPEVRVALVSRKGSSLTDYTIPEEPGRFVHFDQVVATNASGARLLDGLCPMPIASRGPACSIPTRNIIRPISGKIGSFLRQDSKKVFVLVSTNDSQVMFPEVRKILSETLPGQNPTIHAFVEEGTFPQGGKCTPITGPNYHQITDLTGGEAFDICAENWSQSFEKIAPKIERLSIAPFPLPAEITQDKIISVSLDGVELASNLYQITSEGLVLDRGLTSSGGIGELVIRLMK